MTLHFYILLKDDMPTLKVEFNKLADLLDWTLCTLPQQRYEGFLF